MALRFRSLIPYTLPGVLALIGWWWYVSRKKGRISSHDTEDGVSLELPEQSAVTTGATASAEDSNRILEERNLTPTAAAEANTDFERKKLKQNKEKRQEKKAAAAAAKQEVAVEIHMPVSASAMERLAQTLPVETLRMDATSTCSSSLAELDTGTPEAALVAILASKEGCIVTSCAQEPSVLHPRNTEEGAPTSLRPVGAEEAFLLTEELQCSDAPLLEESVVVPAAAATTANVILSSVEASENKQKEMEEVLQLVAATAFEVLETKAVSSDARLTEAVRPEPEGEVAADKISVPFTEKKQQAAAVKATESSPSRPLSKDETSTATEEAENCKTKSGSREPLCSEIHPSSSCCLAATPPPEETPNHRIGKPLENGLSEGAAGNMEEIESLAAGLISEVIMAAKQEVLTVSQCEEVVTVEQRGNVKAEHRGSSISLSNGRACAVRDQEKTESRQTSKAAVVQSSTKMATSTQTKGGGDGQAKANTAEEEHTAEVQVQTCLVLNGCLPTMWEKRQESGRRRASEQSVSLEATHRLVAETVAGAEDSGCSTCQSEDGISSEDLLQSTGLSGTLPERKADMLGVSNIEGVSESGESASEVAQGMESTECGNGGLDGSAASLRNESRWATDTEADHSGGSDVNSMDSVDSGCTLGGETPRTSSQQSLQLLKSELTIWEIEVPKHLVGRLIGKQGRYVSFLKQNSGAKIYISTLPYTQEFQICHIEGSQPQVDKALGLIGKKFKELDLTNLYAPPPLPLPSLPMTSWLLLPDGVSVEVIVVNIMTAGHMFVQQNTHPTFHALRSLDQQMFLCYAQPGVPALPSQVEVGVICAAPAVEGAWWRAQVINFYKDSSEVEIRYVDYGGYERVKIDALRQIRSDFVTLPFQGAEVLLDNVVPLPGEDRFPSEADSVLEEMTRGAALLAQVTNYDRNTGLPLIQLWNMVGDELVSINRVLVERGFGSWVDNF
ncbi:A kinase (PRKA) anchor protein 1b [Polyodon spathula]|uniref:A kinase (PRKA) anchor protein 1b n=1 Tax=Polyodon spathula TaxID=7913 RepID=UPI001B7E796C|nr:A kinase (PRKA) anchor protein 1b [Polyodon spathula]XP_041097280.1 A kinase (PRKA) anchor protein 1b [Polyodon spathula]XP_041097281.1 A kinase (PRKA) anchor protein 1b [Polyodon spathula]XP_041097282.1 A kinase (PRKA) anchor protein 1b [Polyodon spathula]XP_041097283.1 A kinase (PRKA) anchor protein 1b [Polyodon spathula]XP_041097284.1 A kinase (PRKA) anchor protein 1b [Polyodon spathula]